MRRRAVPISSAQSDDAEASRLQDGEIGWRYHWRHGLVGSITYWACSYRSRVIQMLVGLATEFGVKKEVGEQLNPDRDTIAAQRAIALNIRGVVSGLKPIGAVVKSSARSTELCLQLPLVHRQRQTIRVV